jgi:RES domain-containing protein
MIRAWRLIKAEHADDAFAAEGSRRGGGRWNSKGVRIVYTSGSLSLATLEVMVHTLFYSALKNYVCIPIDFDPGLSKSIRTKDLPDNWTADPIPKSVRDVGDRWVQNQESVILKVPSAIIAVEYNYLINPSHPDFGKVVIHSPQKFAFDPRLLERLSK